MVVLIIEEKPSHGRNHLFFFSFTALFVQLDGVERCTNSSLPIRFAIKFLNSLP